MDLCFFLTNVGIRNAVDGVVVVSETFISSGSVGRVRWLTSLLGLRSTTDSKGCVVTRRRESGWFFLLLLRCQREIWRVSDSNFCALFLLYRFFFSPFFSLFINGRRETRKTSFLFLLVRHVQSERKKRGEKGNEREKKKEILSLFSLCSPHQSETTRNPLKKETRPVTYDTYRSSTNAMDFSCSVLFFCCASFMHACLHVIVIDDREYTPDS